MSAHVRSCIKILYVNADTDLHISTPRSKTDCRSAYDDTLTPKASQRAIPSSKSREYCVHTTRTETEEMVYYIFVKIQLVYVSPHLKYGKLESGILRFPVNKAWLKIRINNESVRTSCLYVYSQTKVRANHEPDRIFIKWQHNLSFCLPFKCGEKKAREIIKEKYQIKLLFYFCISTYNTISYYTDRFRIQKGIQKKVC